jgi:hypothetical protein
MVSLEVFKKNYTGIYDADHYYAYLVACEKAERDLSNATYSPAQNRRLVENARTAAFNHHVRNRRP